MLPRHLFRVNAGLYGALDVLSVSCQPGQMSALLADGVYEVCSLGACSAGRVVVDQVIRRDRIPGELQTSGWLGET